MTERENLLREALRACRTAFIGAGAISLVINLLMLTTSIYMMQVFDRVLSSGSLPTLLYLTLVAGGAVLLLAVLDVVRSRLLVLVSAWIEETLASPAFARMTATARSGDYGRGDPLADLSSLRGFLAGQGVLALFDAPCIPIYLAAIYLLHSALGHVALVGATLLFCLALANDAATHKRLKKAASHLRRAGAKATAALRNAEAVQAMGMQATVAEWWANDGRQALRLQTEAAKRASLVIGASKFFRLFVQIGMLGLGAKLVLEHEITGGAMIAASIILGRALAPLEQAIAGWKQAVQALDSKRRLENFFSQVAPQPGAIALPPPEGRVSVERVVHRLELDKPPVLKGVAFELAPGQALGVIGPSAAGKSTLARLLVGIEAPVSGSIRLDGADVSAWSREELGRYVGYLPQGVELFAGTVADNIARLGEPDANAVVRAATLANCHEMILRLSRGYATELGENAMRLSGGQRQRIALARALYGDPKLVVLDEPCANLDAEGEAAFNQALARVKGGGATLIVIGHRLSAFAAVDKVLVLVDGAVQLFGPRAEVLERLKRRVVQPVAGIAPQLAAASVPSPEMPISASIGAGAR